MNKPIYLDHCATTPLRAEVLESMLPYLKEDYGNPSSLHRWGRSACDAVETAREQVAQAIEANPREIVFTSGGTEANNLALRGSMDSGGDGRSNLLVLGAGHASILEAAKSIAKSGNVQLASVGVNRSGLVDLESLDGLVAQLSPKLFAAVLGDNETGVIQPFEKIVNICRVEGSMLHLDAVQCLGKMPLNGRDKGVTTMSLSAHKIGGPKGVGALFVRKGTTLTPQMVGGGQQRRLRGGTENVAGIVGFGRACEFAREELEKVSAHVLKLRNDWEAKVMNLLPDSMINAVDSERLPHVSNIAFPNIEADHLVYALDSEGLAVSAGPACSSGSVDPSPTLLAMGRSIVEARSALRFSFGKANTSEELERAALILKRVVLATRAL